MADAAQLKLQVGLDLAFFRQQLAQLGTTAAGYSLPINIDRLGIQKEITKLGKNISGRKYTLKITSDVSGINADIIKLQNTLKSIGEESVNIQVTGTGSLSVKEARKIRTDLRASILANGGKIKVPATITAAITRADITAFKNAVKEKLDGVSVNVSANVKGGGAGTGLPPDYMKYMAEQGLLGKTARGMTMQMGKSGDDIKQQLNDAVQSAEKIKSVFDGVAQSIATTGKSIATIQGKRLGLANVPLMAGGVEKRIGQSATAIGGTTSFDALKALYPEVSKTITSLAALKGQIQQNTSKLSGFSLIIALAAFAGVPLAKSVVKLTGSADNFAKLLDKLGLKLDAAFTKAASNILSAASSRLLGGGSVAGLLPAAYRGIGPSAGPAGLLPPAYRGIGPSRNAKALPPAYRGLPFGFDFRGLPPESGATNKAGKLGPTVQQMRQQRLSALRIQEAQVRDISGTFDIVGNFNSGQKAASQKRLNKAVVDLEKGLEEITRRAMLQAGVRQVNVADLGGVTRPALPGGRSPLMLPPAGGTTAGDRIRVSTGAYVGQPGFMQAPSIPSPVGGGGAPPAPPTPPGGGRGGSSGFGGFANAMAGIQLPGAGVISELGGEFAMAAKQVLLFGTAYKALAFLTDFPGKVGDAVGQLQTFRNTLTTVTGGGQEFGKSNKFILDLVEKYNVPLQSARDGFTKLYASMAPAGFKGDEIRNIFTGISQGAATFGMSADKVDRVNYAFAQMASKGQVMSEELKGQLGDVLPGAVAIFAEAAGFTGPEAMVKFTKAMEDGRYKGAAMKQLLINVGTVMNKEFGPGAEGAARTFQGLMNRMQNATLKLYEAFEPMAIGFANKVVLPMTDGLRVAADGFNAFFTGQQAVTKGGADLAAKLQELKPTFEGLATNAKAVADRVIDLSKAFVPLLELGAKLLATPLAGFLAQTYVSVLLLNSAFTALGGRFVVTSMVAYFSRLNTALVLTQAQMIATGGAANAMSLRILAAGSTSVGAASATTQLTFALRAMWVAMTGPVGLGVAALAAVTAAAYLMNKPFKEYIDSMPARFANFWRDLQSQATVSISNVIAMWQYLATVTSETFRSMTSGASALYDGLVGALGPIAPWFGNMMQWLKDAWIETIAFMVNQSSPVLGIAKTLGVDVGKTLMVNLTKDRNLPAPGQFTPAGGVSFDAQGNPIGASLSPFIPGGGALSPIPGATGDDSRGSAAKDAKRIAEQIKQQLKSAQDLKFEQQNRLTLLRAENDFTKAFTNFSIQRLEIERRYTELLKQSVSPEETAVLQQARSAEYKQSSLTLQQRINELLKQSQAPLNDAVESIKNQVAFEREYGELIKNGTNPEVAKQILAIRKAYNESVKLLEPALAAAQAAVTKAKAEGASATEIQKYREELEKIEAIRKGLEGKKAEGEAAAVELNKPKTPTETIEGRISTLKTEIAELTNIGNIAIKVADGIGAAFGQAFEGLITGSMSAQEALGNFFKSIGNMFIQMAAEIIAKQMTMIVLGFLMKALGLTAGIGSAGNAAGAAAFSPGNSSAFQAIPGQAFSMPKLAANGATFSNGIAKFATGGIVNGPTLFPFADGGAMQMGLMGEAGPEAILPLQRGSDGSLGVRAAMGGNGMGGSSSPVLNMNFETSTINGVEYVSRDQLEAAMAQTRRQASRDGANKGMAMTLDKIQQSPQTRRRIGM